MTNIQNGRFTAEIDGDFAIFIIGMRFNKLHKVRSWLQPFLAMPKMLRELDKHPEIGLMNTRMSLSGKTITLTQYWRSFDQLEAFAKNPSQTHLAAWREFNKRIGASGEVGIYHETYRIGPGQHETIYGNMPIMGLAAAGRSVPIGGRNQTARKRLNPQTT